MSMMVLAMQLGSAAVGCRLEAEAPPVIADQAADQPGEPEQRLAPDFSLASHDGRTVALGDLLAKGPAILVFYRGHW